MSPTDRSRIDVRQAQNSPHDSASMLTARTLWFWRCRGAVFQWPSRSRSLDAPMDVFLVRKLGLPGHRELAMGAIASGGVRVLNEDVIQWYRVSERAIDEVVQEELIELERRERNYRQGRPLIDLHRCTVILVDDGLATGSTMRAAVLAVRQHGPAHVIVGVPVGAPSTCEELADITDETVCARTPESFSAVGQWYMDFSQTTDDEVRALLHEHAARHREARRRP
jgi:putative phosphoribosyl transferase